MRRNIDECETSAGSMKGLDPSAGNGHDEPAEEDQHRSCEARDDAEGDCQPQSLTLTMRERQRGDADRHLKLQPMGPGRATSWPGTSGSFHQPMITSATTPNRHVDEEDPAPACRDQHATDQRAECRRQTTDRGPGPDRAAALGPAETTPAEDRATSVSSGLRRLPAATRNATSISTLLAAAQAAEASSKEPPRQGKKAEITRIPFGEAPEKYQQRGVGDRVAVQDPREILKAWIVEFGWRYSAGRH